MGHGWVAGEGVRVGVRVLMGVRMGVRVVEWVELPLLVPAARSVRVRVSTPVSGPGGDR